MNSRKFWILVAGLLFGISIAGYSVGQIVSTGGATVPTLKQQLVTGLLARTPQEQEFIDKVVAQVDSGELPLGLVQSTFLWARKHRPYPMQYFERALRVRANDVGISIN